MKRLIDRDPISGKEVWFDYDQNSDQMTLTHNEPVEHVLDYCASMRQLEDRTKRQMKDDWIHYAIVPEAVQMDMKIKHGVDFWDKNDRRKVFALLNTDYARFKTATIRHNVSKTAV